MSNRDIPLRDRPSFALLIVLLVAVVLIVLDYCLGEGWLSWAYWQQGGNNTSRSEVLRNVGLLLVGVIGLGFGIWRAYTAYRQTKTAHRQADIAEQGLFTDRFSTAAEQLGSQQLPVRLGGIYALWRLAQDSPGRDMTAVVDMLCAFVRNPPPDPTIKLVIGRPTPVRPDAQAILDLLGGKDAEYRNHLPTDYRLNLSAAPLAQANLTDSNFASANLSEAILSNASLLLADLSRTELTRAKLLDADLEGADLGYADLTGADLSGARALCANLGGADLMAADLKEANLHEANFSKADLIATNFEGAALGRANFRGANLKRANLSNAKLTDADLSYANNLTQEQLANIRFDPESPPKLPPGLVLPEQAPPKD